MKIIKKGALPVKLPYVYGGTCSFCSCEIEVTEKEASGRSGIFRCPTEGCDGHIHVERRLDHAKLFPV